MRAQLRVPLKSVFSRKLEEEMGSKMPYKRFC